MRLPIYFIRDTKPLPIMTTLIKYTTLKLHSKFLQTTDSEKSSVLLYLSNIIDEHKIDVRQPSATYSVIERRVSEEKIRLAYSDLKLIDRFVWHLN